MFKNHIKIAWRNILRKKGISSLNIIGLSVGIASCLAILLFVRDEMSYDKYNEKAGQIVRVVFDAKINGEVIKEAIVMAPVAETLKEELPEVIDGTRLANVHNPKIIYENKSYRNSRLAYVDSNFFDIFSLPVIDGNFKNPLVEPNTAVITKSEAKKIFGEMNPLGQSLQLENGGPLIKITALINDVPKNSHFHFDIFLSSVGYPPAIKNTWMESQFYTYLLLKDGTDADVLEQKLPNIVERYMGPQIRAAFDMPFSNFKKNNSISLKFQSLTDIHLFSDRTSTSELEQGGDIKYIYIFSIVALLMLILACINFINLSTAASAKRAQEVGIRKVLGAEKKQLIHQFLIESFIVIGLATIIAIFLLLFTLPLFNAISGKELQVEFLMSGQVLVYIALIFLVMILLAGGYPAFFLSGFKPMAAFKNSSISFSKSGVIRNELVVFQFVISAGLILSMFVIYTQMNYLQNKDTGYDKYGIIVLRDAHYLGSKLQSFKNELLEDSRVISITQSPHVPAGPSDDNMTSIFKNGMFQRRVSVYNVDDQYIPTMGMHIVAGRNFSKDFGSDSLSVIINERAAEIFNIHKDKIGGKITIGTDNNGGRKELKIVGIVKDFNFTSLHNPIEPLIMLYNPYGGLVIRARTADMPNLIKTFTKQWNLTNIKEPFSYSILDSDYNHTYLDEQKLGNILGIFTFLIIFIACLGLFGLVTFSTEQRIKEIGIRKILGSSVAQIVGLLSKDFLKLVIMSFIIAFPLGFYLMNRWLQNFAYRVEISWWMFVLTAGITLFLAFSTICFKSINAAQQNPVKSLKME